jgi:hypothetical protein
MMIDSKERVMVKRETTLCFATYLIVVGGQFGLSLAYVNQLTFVRRILG